MNLLRFFSPVRAYRDLRQFLATRRRHEYLFMLLSLVLTSLVVFAFYKDSNIEKPYERNILYVQNWPLDRSLAQIKAQQEIDAAAKARRDAALERRRRERQEQFKRVDEQLDKWGI